MNYTPSDCYRLVSWDCETALFTDTELAPWLACASVGRLRDDYDIEKLGVTELGPDAFEGRLLERDEALEVLESLLRDPEVLIVGAKIDYDMAVAVNEKPELLPLVLAAYDAERIACVLLSTALDALAAGHMGKNPDGSPFPVEPGKEVYLDGPKKGQKRPPSDRYSLWQSTRLETGRVDAKDRSEYRLAYEGLAKSLPVEQWPEKARQYPVDDVKNPLEVFIRQILRQSANINNVAFQAAAAFAEYLAAMVGLNVDFEQVSILDFFCAWREQFGLERFVQTGIIRPDGSQDQKLTKKRLLKASGAPECPEPQPPPPERKKRKCRHCKGTWVDPETKATCGHCERGMVLVGKNPIPHHKCPQCDGLEYLRLPTTIPTETGGVSIAREVLRESADHDLVAYAEYSEDVRAATTYLPWLMKANPTLHPYPNVLLVTGRSSYEGPAQLLPTKGPVRGCITAGPGRLLGSIDYGQIELLAWSQVCIWTLGQSVMGEAINAGKDLHIDFAAEMLDTTYEVLYADHKSKKGPKFEEADKYRKTAKIANFGYPGGMGAKTLVLNQKSKRIRICKPFGHERCNFVPLRDKEGNLVGGAICEICFGIAKDLKARWYRKWNAQPYFDWIQAVVRDSGQIAQLVPKGMGVTMPGMPCDVSRIRGGVRFSDAANSPFQGMAADGAKAALWEVTKACYQATRHHNRCLVGVAPVLFIHDELLFTLPEDQAEDAMPVLQGIMEAAMRKYVPDVASGVKTGASTMTHWTK